MIGDRFAIAQQRCTHDIGKAENGNLFTIARENEGCFASVNGHLVCSTRIQLNALLGVTGKQKTMVGDKL